MENIGFMAANHVIKSLSFVTQIFRYYWRKELTENSFGAIPAQLLEYINSICSIHFFNLKLQ